MKALVIDKRVRPINVAFSAAGTTSDTVRLFAGSYPILLQFPSGFATADITFEYSLGGVWIPVYWQGVKYSVSGLANTIHALDQLGASAMLLDADLRLVASASQTAGTTLTLYTSWTTL